jgi:site-specific DNA-adenine methylase
MITCERCGLTIHGNQMHHATAEDCLRYLIPRYAALEAMAKRQAEHATRLEQRLERAQLQTRTAEQACRTALKDVKHERDRAARIERTRNTVYTSLLRAQAQAKTEKRRYAQTLARMRKLAVEYLEHAA